VIHIVTAENAFQYRTELEQAFRLRHKVFVEEMGWTDLAREDGREIDQFDNKYAAHMLYIEENKVRGCQRMLPTTRPHLLSEVLPQLCEGKRPVGAHIWELTRHCVDREHREKTGRIASPAANILLSGMVEWALESGITTIIAEIEPATLLRLIQLHFRPLPLGLPMRISGRDTIAVTLSFDERTLMRLRDMRGDAKRVLAEQARAPSLLHA